MAAYSNMPDGMEPGLENNAYYDPPNLTWPFACYIATVEVDPQTGVWTCSTSSPSMTAACASTR
jgi:carbon-monoxide dehydrogenase large subunit